MTHDDEFPLTEHLIRDLLSEHVPQWSSLPLERVRSTGTDNALYRLGRALILRLPRRASAACLISKELDWLPRLHNLPLETPRLRYRGRADCGMECEFGIFDWIEGDIAVPGNIADVTDAAVSLAKFLKALHTISTEGAPAAGVVNKRRGIALAQMSELTRPAIEMVSDEVERDAAEALWQSAVAANETAAAVWLHGDLKADNLLTRNGSLSGVIDWGLSAVGDPAADYASAWSWVHPSAREMFRATLEMSDADWLRAKGWALYGAVIALSYYRGGKNEELCRQSRLTLSRLGLLR